MNNRRILNILTICASVILGVNVFGMSEPVKVYAQNDSTIDLPTGDIVDPGIRVGEVQSKEITPEEFNELERNVPRRRAKFASYNGNYYNQLTASDKLYYNAILEASVKNIGAYNDFSEDTSILFYTGNDKLEDPDWAAILDALEYDHPEQLESIVYGVNRYYKWTTENGNLNYAYYIYFTPRSSYTGAQLAQMESTLQSKLDSFYAGLTLTGDDANKEMIIHDALIDAIEYDHECADNNLAFDVAHTAYGALVDHSAVCDGYSKAFKMLLNMAGIDSEVVAGLGNGGGHAWNVVKIGNSWYETDVTWDDHPNYTENKYYFMLSHEYFNLTTSDFNSHLEEVPGFVSRTTTHVRSSKYLSYLEPPVAYGTEKSYRNIKQVYKIAFNGTFDGAIVYPSSSYTYEGKMIEMPSLTYMSGYDFDNWYTEETGGSIVTSDTVFKKASTVYARWIPVDVNVYLQTEIGSTEIITLKYGEAYSSKLPDNLKREGYVFAGWYLDSGYTDRVTASTKVSKSYNHNLYARWISNGEHNIYFNANGGEVDIESVVMAGGAEIGDMPTPTRYGYSFRGWYDAQEGGNKITRYTVVSADAELYAHWTPVSVIVYFYKNDGSVSYSSKSVDYEGTYENALSSLYKYTWLGHTLIGWFTEKDGGTQITPDTIVKTTDSHNLYAHWSVDSYNVSLDANGGSVDEESVSVEWGTSYGSLPTPVRYGYTFDGWYDESGKIMPVYNKIVKDMALHAGWTPVDVNVYLSTGLNNNERITLKFGETYSNKLPYNLNKKGCLLEGWYLDSGYENKVQDNTTVSNAATHYLYARWISNGDHNITYNPNGGKADTENVILAGGDVFGDMPTPTRYGYSFRGWYDAQEGGNEITSSSVVSEDAELYAHWTPVQSTVRFYENIGGVNDSYQESNVFYDDTYASALESIINPVNDGFTFIGWYTEPEGGSGINAEAVVTTTDLSCVYAHWEKNASEEPGGSDNPAPQENHQEIGKDNQNKSDDVNNPAPQEDPEETGKDNQNKSDDVNNPAPQEDPEGTGKDNQNKSDDVNNPAPQEDPEETGKNNQNKSDDVNKQVPQDHKNDIANGNESGKGSNKSQSGFDQKDNEVVHNETQPASGGQSVGNRDESTPDQSNQGSLDDHARDNSINDDSDKSKIDKSGSGNIGTIAKTSSANTNSTAGNNTAKTSSVKTGSVVVVNGAIYVVTGKNEADYKGIKSGKAETVTIPATIKIKGETYKVTGISSKAFRKKTKLRKVTIGKNVTRIGSQAFEGCTALTTVNGGSSVRTIGAKAYNGCKKLKKAPIGSKVTSIGNMAFYNCSALTNMTIPANVDKLGKQFAGKTPKLKTLTVKTKKLNTKGVTNKAFTGMGSNKTVTKVPKGKAKAYKSLFQKKGLNKKIKVQ